MEIIITESQLENYISDKTLELKLIPAEMRRRIGLYLDMPLISKLIRLQIKRNDPSEWDVNDSSDYAYEIISEVAEKLLILKGDTFVGDITPEGLPSQERWGMLFEIILSLYGEDIEKFFKDSFQ